MRPPGLLMGVMNPVSGWLDVTLCIYTLAVRPLDIFFPNMELQCLELETYLNLCSYKLTTLSYHLALGEKKTLEFKISHVAERRGLTGAGATPPTPQ